MTQAGEPDSATSSTHGGGGVPPVGTEPPRSENATLPPPGRVPPSRPAPPAGRWRLHAAYLGLLLLMVIAAVVYDGVRRENAGAAVIPLAEPPGPSAGVPTTAPAISPPSAMPPPLSMSPAPRPSSAEGELRLRVATFNIASGRGPDGRTDLARTLETLRRASPLDVVGLQEVRQGWFGGVSQAGELAASLVMRWADVPSERRWWREHFGNAVLTREAGDDVLRLPLPQTQERGQRNVAVLRARLLNDPGGRAVTVLVTHIDRRVDQPAQLRFVTSLFRSVEPPAVLLGDLNVTRDHPLLRELLQDSDVTDAAAGFPGLDTPGRIDHILVRGLRPVAAGRVDLGASDHPLIWAELALPPQDTP